MTYSLFNLKGNNCIAGAYLQNIGAGAMPIYGSIINLNYEDSEFDDVADAIFVVPGFKAIIYEHPNYSGNNITIDNRNGRATYINMISEIHNSNISNNKVSSIRLYDYNNNQITIPNS